MARFLPDRYVCLLILAAVLGFLLPDLGASDGPLNLGLVTKIGISLVFFLHGANLAPDSLAAGVRNWKVHALIQATTFALFPILGGVLFVALDGVLSDSLRLGFFFLAALEVWLQGSNRSFPSFADCS